MKRPLALIIIGLIGVSCYAQLDDGFDYPDGELSTVSQGRWQRTGLPGTVDPLVVNGQLKMRSNADTVAFVPSVFGGGVFGASVGFDFLSSNRGSAPYFGYWMFVGSVGIQNEQTVWNYGSGLMLNFNKGYYGHGVWKVRVDYFSPDWHSLGWFDLDVWHQARLALRYEPDDQRVNFDFRMDNLLIRQDYFYLTDPLGLNSVNVYGGEDRAGLGSMLLDNISVRAVPEPGGTLAALVSVCLMARWRRGVSRRWVR